MVSVICEKVADKNGSNGAMQGRSNVSIIGGCDSFLAVPTPKSTSYLPESLCTPSPW